MIYSSKSNICQASIHSGISTSSGGEFVLKEVHPPKIFFSSSIHNVNSKYYSGSSDGAFVLGKLPNSLHDRIDNRFTFESVDTVSKILNSYDNYLWANASLYPSKSIKIVNEHSTSFIQLKNQEVNLMKMNGQDEGNEIDFVGDENVVDIWCAPKDKNGKVL